MANLFELSGEYMEVLSMLEDPDVSEDVVQDTLESIEGDIHDKMDAYCYIIAQLSSQEDLLMAEVVRLTKRAKSLERNADRLKDNLYRAMKALGQKNVKTPKHTVYIRSTADSLVIDDMSAVPEECMKVQKTVSRPAIRKYLQENGECDWAHLETSESLVIK